MGVLDDPRIAAGMKRQFAWRRTRLDAGEKPIGWKAGFGAVAAQQKLGTSAPLAGFLTDRMLLDDGATVPIAGWTQAVVEPEIAIHIGRDLGAGADEATARAAISALGVAFELADVDAPPDGPEDVERLLAGNIFNRHVIVAPPSTAYAGGDVTGLKGTILRNGALFAETSDLESNTGRLVGIVRAIADAIGSMGETLHAGQFIIGGAIVPPVFVDRAAEEVDYAVPGLGRLTVRVER